MDEPTDEPTEDRDEAKRRRLAKSARESRMVTAAVIGCFVLVAAGGYVWQKIRNGPFVPEPYIASARAEAKATVRDAVLISVDATYVDERGRVQAAFEEEGGRWRYAGTLTLVFRSIEPVAVKPAKPVPLGAPAPAQPEAVACRHLEFKTGLRGGGRSGRFGTESRWREASHCGKAPVVPEVRCSLAAIWQRAIAAGAPHPAFASLSLRGTASDPSWHFAIVDRANQDRVVFAGDYADDCH